MTTVEYLLSTEPHAGFILDYWITSLALDYIAISGYAILNYIQAWI